MIEPHPVTRAATREDAAAMAELVNFAGEGLPLYLWSKMATPGQDPWDVGRARAQRETGGFSYRNTIILEQDGQVVGCLIGYPLPDEPEPVDYDAMPLQPLFFLAQLIGGWVVRLRAVGLAEDHSCDLPMTQGELADAQASPMSTSTASFRTSGRRNSLT